MEWNHSVFDTDYLTDPLMKCVQRMELHYLLILSAFARHSDLRSD